MGTTNSATAKCQQMRLSVTEHISKSSAGHKKITEDSGAFGELERFGLRLATGSLLSTSEKLSRSSATFYLNL